MGSGPDGPKNAYPRGVKSRVPSSSGNPSTLSTLSVISDSIRDSMHALLGMKKPSGDDEAVIEIRKAMMKLHGETGLDDNPRLHHRIATARDAESLWYMRAELYADLCHRHDERQAQRSLDALVPLFQGQIPPSLLKTRKPRTDAVS